MQETWVRTLGWENLLEKGQATHSSILAGRIPWTVQAMGSQSRTQLSDFHSLTHQSFHKKEAKISIHSCLGIFLSLVKSLEWVSEWLSESRSVVSDSLWPHGLHSPWNSPGQNTRTGSLSLLQGIFPTQNQTQISRIEGRFFTSWAIREAQEYWSGSPIPSPVDLPDPGIEPGSPALQTDFFTNWAIREALNMPLNC